MHTTQTLSARAYPQVGPGSRMIRVLRTIGVGLSLATLAAMSWPPVATAAMGTGPHETLDLSFSTPTPGAPAGVHVSVEFRNPSDPQANPPALRRAVTIYPAGSRIDTSVPARCSASDQELQQNGDSACPAASRIGTGTVTTAPLGTPPSTYDVSIFNTDGGQIQLVKSPIGSGGAAVARATIRNATVDVMVPTCLTGGQPPSGCPTDQTTLLKLAQTLPSYTSGASQRAYFTTPPDCPSSGSWQTTSILTYADGATDTVATNQPCAQTRPPAAGSSTPGSPQTPRRNNNPRQQKHECNHRPRRHTCHRRHRRHHHRRRADGSRLRSPASRRASGAIWRRTRR
jgi:hypothetical protein